MVVPDKDKVIGVNKGEMLKVDNLESTVGGKIKRATAASSKFGDAHKSRTDNRHKESRHDKSEEDYRDHQSRSRFPRRSHPQASNRRRHSGTNHPVDIIVSTAACF